MGTKTEIVLIACREASILKAKPSVSKCVLLIAHLRSLISQFDKVD